MTFDPDLSDSDKAIFIAGFQQKGLPVGVPQQYVNEQLYQHANAVQNDKDLNFESGSGDYFSYQNNYLANVVEVENDAADVDDVHKRYLSARRTVDAEYQNLRRTFDMMKQQDSKYKWLDHARSRYGQAYRDAWEQRDQMASELPIRDLAHLLQITDSAQSRIEPRTAQNMPAIQGDRDLVSMDRPIDPKSVIYRPLHYLSGFETDSKVWRDQYNIEIVQPYRKDLNLRTAIAKPWASLGFPHFDTAELDITAAEAAHLDDWQVYMTYTRMATYTVYRGLWDIPNFRTLLPNLRTRAAKDLSCPINKTTALLLAYGLQLNVKVPTIRSSTTRDLVSKITDGVPLDHDVSTATFKTPKPENDAYPLLLAVMTQKS